jgi:hypothetical protein
MTAALGTLPFLATLWLLVVLGAAVLENSRAKIAAALKGNFLQRPTPSTPEARRHNRTGTQIIRCASAGLRAAA